MELSALVTANQFTLDQLDNVEKMGFYHREIKYHANRLKGGIERLYVGIFKGANIGTTEYYIQMVEFCKMQIRIFNHLYKSENQGKLAEFRKRYTALLEDMKIIKPSDL